MTKWKAGNCLVAVGMACFAAAVPVRAQSSFAEPQTFLDDYREVDGVFFAYKYKHVEKGNVFTVRVTKVENNAAVDDSLFTTPDVVMTTR